MAPAAQPSDLLTLDYNKLHIIIQLNDILSIKLPCELLSSYLISFVALR